MIQLNCHKCPYNGKGSDQCLKCTKGEQTLKSIINEQTLVEFGRDMERFSQRFKDFSRQRAFQTRKRLLNKLGVEFKEALTTMGQRKELKI